MRYAHRAAGREPLLSRAAMPFLDGAPATRARSSLYLGAPHAAGRFEERRSWSSSAPSAWACTPARAMATRARTCWASRAIATATIRPRSLIELVVQPRSDPAAIEAARGALRGRRPRGRGLRRSGRADPRSPAPPGLQRGAAPPRRGPGERRGDRHHLPARPRLSRRADRARRCAAGSPTTTTSARRCSRSTARRPIAPARRAVVAKQRAERGG